MKPPNIKRNFLLIVIIFTLTIANAYAHKDRIERPQDFKFIFFDDTLYFRNPTDSILEVINEDIISHKKNLIEAQLIFETGEKMVFKYDKSKLKGIEIFYGKKGLSVPLLTIDKISEIHFGTVALLWDGDYKKAFSSSYFYIRFEIGTEKSFNKLPNLELHFSDNKFSKAMINRQINQNTIQGKEF